MELNRRAFFARAFGLAGFAASEQAKVAEAGEITEQTIAETEKLVYLSLTPEQRRKLVPTSRALVADIKALRGIALPRDLEGALVFNPRLAGVDYPSQQNVIRLATPDVPALPGTDADIAYAPVGWLSHWLQTRQLTASRLTDIYLARIDRIAPSLQCFVTVTADLARTQARECDNEIAAGKYRGPLHGIPYAIKDLFDTAGIRTSWGNVTFKDRVPAEDAAVVTMLRDEGAVLLGKAVTGEFARGSAWFGGDTRNPWNLEESSSGSSAGPASGTAAALCAFAIGTDSTGSLIGPAERCGVVGLRPTFARVPGKGCLNLSPTLGRIGPLCRRVEDAALVLAAIHGPDPSSVTSVDVGFAYDANLDFKKLKIGYAKPAGGRTPTAPQQQAFEALRELGVKLVEVKLPDLPYRVMNGKFVESASVLEDMTTEHDERDFIPDSAWPNAWRQAHFFSAVTDRQVQRFRRLVMQEMQKIFTDIDILLDAPYGSNELGFIMNFTGQPGLSLRVGLIQSASRGMAETGTAAAGGPLHTITQNLTFHGRLYEEGTLLALGRALEAKVDTWKARAPVG
jgi:Asp-tRNA(Asn)/Glu-tRNA(Gln) amidotransferase A subunit family amidase